jgi:DNA invertase Pin-like site-specific DNA recombinase
MSQNLAIVTCRVSSNEQLESNSLNRQEKSVREAALFLGVSIPLDGVWSGSVSSKSGKNFSRKDLDDMLTYCKHHPSVKYLIVDEIDRFMRSIDEMFYFEVLFRESVGVKIWYAGDPALNSDDPLTKLRRAMEAFKAEGSNLERQIKSIKGQTDALKMGRYPFPPKPGYKKGTRVAIHEIDDLRGPILQSILLNVHARRISPAQALVDFNKSDFMLKHSPYKMDKFRKIIIDPYYAGIVEVDKQVKVRNENGLHEPLITKAQHFELIRIMNDKKKVQTGPNKNGNPKYPLSNIITHTECLGNTICRLVGFDHGNGKPNSVTYEKYRCRACGKYLTRQELHSKIEKHFASNIISAEGQIDLLSALKTVWKQNEGQAIQDVTRLKQKIKELTQTIEEQVEAVTDPENANIKQDILNAITKKKLDALKLQEELENLLSETSVNQDNFLQFAFSFINDMGSQFLSISKENRLRCKQVIFPGGFYLDNNDKVFTPEISPLIRLAKKKKDTEVSINSHLVRVRGL